MKKIVWILSLILCLATFVVSPSAQADEPKTQVQVSPSTTAVPSFTVEDEGEIWKHASPAVVNVPGFTVQGGTVYHSAYADTTNWTLLNGTGERKFITRIYFRDPYQKPPTVTAFLTGLDVGNDTNHRLTVKPVNVTRTGFDLEYKTWGDSHISSTRSTWTAFGE